MPHPRYLLEAITSEELSEWEAYNMLEPIGDFRGSGILSSGVRRDKEQTPEEMGEFLRRFIGVK